MAVPRTVRRVGRRERQLRAEQIREEEIHRSALRKEDLRQAQIRRKRIEAVKAVFAFLGTIAVFAFLYWLANTRLH